jgi:hypothetical protein
MVNDMWRSEAWTILGELWDNATEDQRKALRIAQRDIEFVDLMPDDMVHVVRCKDCKHRKLSGVAPFMYYCCNNNDGLVGGLRDEDFCSYGERKEAEGDG